MAVYKNAEFKEFIKEIESGAVAHWKEIAEALDVDQDTITKWKNTPEAIEARRKGIAVALEGMQTAGKKDWRMWEARLKMLGINPPQNIKAEIDDPRKAILDKYLGGDSVGQTPEAKS